MTFRGKILLVDDEPHVRKFVGLIVRGLGAPTLLEAANGREAIDLYRREAPDLVLLDVNMPHLDGLATLRELRELDPEAVVVMLTSLANRQTVEECAELGATDYLRKDTPRAEITEKLASILAVVFGADDKPAAPAS
jgi:CheY-like chemotaxis protein